VKYIDNSVRSKSTTSTTRNGVNNGPQKSNSGTSRNAPKRTR
jgi:hypothetical protein